MTKRRGLAAFTLAVLMCNTVLVSTTSEKVSADHPAHTLFRPHYANNKWHNWKTTESNSNHRNFWSGRFQSSASDGGEDVYEPTDLSFTKVTGSTYDIYWYVTPISSGAAGDALCTIPNSDGTCSRWRIRIDEDAWDLTFLLEKNLVCHEVGHTVGFGHGSTQDSCMSSGDNNKLNTWEKDKINGHY